jgi:hypothetical protein
MKYVVGELILVMPVKMTIARIIIAFRFKARRRRIDQCMAEKN